MSSTMLAEKIAVNLPFIDRIWHVRGSLPLDPALSPARAFDRLDPLFQTDGTTYAVTHDTLEFRKKAPRAQDRMAIFSHGTLRVARSEDGARLLYDLSSSTLLFCFALPFLFLGIAWAIKESRTPAYVFTGIFCVLYVAGRILEPWLIKSAFARSLSGEAAEGERHLAR
jgi:hypothetical protein